MHEIQRRDLVADDAKIEVQTREDGKRHIVGYASVFYREGDRGTEYEIIPGLRERIMPGAFDRAIAEGQDVRGLVNHKKEMLLGRTSAGTVTVSVDSRGLKYSIDPPDTQLGRDTMVSLQRGDLSRSSFGFWIEKDGYTFREEKDFDVVEVRDVNLYDVGPVTDAAYAGTTSGVREYRSQEFIDNYKAWKQEREQERDEQRLEEAKAKERLEKAKTRVEALG